MNTFHKVIEHFKSQTATAEAMDCSQARISKLANGQSPITADIAIEIQMLTKGKVKASDLRPDIKWSVLK